jgi:hypothetical protein
MVKLEINKGSFFFKDFRFYAWHTNFLINISKSLTTGFFEGYQEEDFLKESAFNSETVSEILFFFKGIEVTLGDSRSP